MCIQASFILSWLASCKMYKMLKCNCSKDVLPLQLPISELLLTSLEIIVYFHCNKYTSNYVMAASRGYIYKYIYRVILISIHWIITFYFPMVTFIYYINCQNINAYNIILLLTSWKLKWTDIPRSETDFHNFFCAKTTLLGVGVSLMNFYFVRNEYFMQIHIFLCRRLSGEEYLVYLNFIFVLSCLNGVFIMCLHQSDIEVNIIRTHSFCICQMLSAVFGRSLHKDYAVYLIKR